MDLYGVALFKQPRRIDKNSTAMGILIKDYGFVLTPDFVKSWGASGSSRFGRLSLVVDATTAVLQAEAARVERVAFIREESRMRRLAKSLQPADEVPAEPRTYSMNAAKFRRKAFAYALLRRSLRFLAFYSISFPVGMPDDVAYRIWNKLLTRLRRSLGLKSYLWCMERQKNGTVHYHMLTNDFMNVTEVNRYAAVCIDNEVSRGACSWGNSCFERYNGVDVKAVVKSSTRLQMTDRMKLITRVARYLSKYMSKDLRRERHRVWHCSRLVSALCVTASVDECDFRELVDEAEASGRPVKVIQAQFASVVICPVIESVAFRDTLIRINDAIYDFFEQHSLF